VSQLGSSRELAFRFLDVQRDRHFQKRPAALEDVDRNPSRAAADESVPRNLDCGCDRLLSDLAFAGNILTFLIPDGPAVFLDVEVKFRHGPSERWRLMQVTVVEVGQFRKGGLIENGRAATMQVDDAVLPQLPDDAIGVDGRDSERLADLL